MERQTGETVERRTRQRVSSGGRAVDRDIQSVVVQRRRFAISSISHCLCLSEVTLNASGPVHLVCLPGEVKYLTHGENVQPVVDSLIVGKNNAENLTRQYSSHKQVAKIE